MKKLADFVPLFTAIMAFMALIGGFSFSVDLIVKPLKQNILHLEADMKELKAGQAELKASVIELKASQDEILSKLSALSK